MWGKVDETVKAKVFPVVTIAAATVLLLGGLGLILGWVQIEIVPTPTDTLSTTTAEEPVAEITPFPQIRPDALVLPSPTPEDPTIAQTAPGKSSGTIRQGALRVSNRTEYPIRVALLSQQAKGKDKSDPPYAAPAHWDFAPQEGANRGLLLSLPNVNLRIKKGDVLVAFAQDGSRRYWGPYVVGETENPVWNSRTQEWQLVIDP